MPLPSPWMGRPFIFWAAREMAFIPIGFSGLHVDRVLEQFAINLKIEDYPTPI